MTRRFLITACTTTESQYWARVAVGVTEVILTSR